MPLLLDDAGFGFTEGLLQSLPQYTIPNTATGIARANVDYTEYNPTILTGPTPVGALGTTQDKGFFGGLLSGLTNILGAAHLDINASGQGVSVVQTPQAGKVLVNTTKAPDSLLANPLLWVGGAFLAGWLIFGRGK